MQGNSANNKIQFSKKTFVARSRNEAELMAKLELGSDFDPLSYKEIETGGFLGFFKTKKYQIIVETPSKKKIAERARQKNKLKTSSAENPTDDKKLQDMKNFISSYGKQPEAQKYRQTEEDVELLKKIFSGSTLSQKLQTATSQKINVSKPELEKYLQAPLKNSPINKIQMPEQNTDNNNINNPAFTKISTEITSIKEQIVKIKSAMKTIPQNNSSQNKQFDKFYNKLIDSDFPESLCRNFLENFEKTLNKIQLEDSAIYQKKLREYLIDHIYSREGVEINSAKKIALLGPTGVGKTTTVAKMAYHFKIDCDKKVRVLTLDTYKFGGITQLEDLCREMGVPFAACYDIEMFKKELCSEDFDITIIDTTGKNYSESKSLEEFRQYCDAVEDIEKYLVLSSDAKYSDMNKINSNFENFGVKGIIFTKCDLCEYFGSVVAFLVKSKNSIVYMTFGKKIDGDLKEAVPYKLVDGILK
ncbi:MAG: hypothetical protein WC337_11040 [Candidatus Muiribacteriota bacterium]